MRASYYMEKNSYEFFRLLDTLDTDRELLDFIRGYRHAVGEGAWEEGKSLAWRLGWSKGTEDMSVTE